MASSEAGLGPSGRSQRGPHSNWTGKPGTVLRAPRVGSASIQAALAPSGAAPGYPAAEHLLVG